MQILLKDILMKNLAKKLSVQNIMRLATPAIAERALIMTVNIFILVIVGQLGVAALAAVSLANNLLDLIQAVFAGLSIGITVITARLHGQKNIEAVKTILIQSITIFAVLGIVTTLLLFIFSENIIMFLYRTKDIELTKMTVVCFRIIVISLPFFLIDVIISASMRGVGNMRTPLVITIIVNAINIIIGLILIFILHMGVSGAALSIVISRTISAIAKLAIANKDYNGLRIKPKGLFDKKLLSKIIKVGIPNMGEQFFLQSGFLGMQMITVTFGTLVLTAYQIASNIINIIFVFPLGFEAAILTLISRSLGAKKINEAKIYANKVCLLSELITCFIAAFVFIFSEKAIGIYTNDAKVIVQGSVLLRILCSYIPITTIFQTISGILKSGGDLSFVLVTNIAGSWLIRLPLAYVLAVIMNFGVYGLLAGLLVDYVIRAIVYSMRLVQGKWKTIKI